MGILWGSTPEQDQLSLLVGSSLLGGQNVQQQLGSIGPAVAPYMAQQAQNKQTEAMKQSTLQMLQANDQDLAQAVQAGAMTPQDAVKMSLERKMSASKAQQPKLSFQKLEDGTYGFADETGGTFKRLGKSEQQAKLPAIAEEYNWAKEGGFKGTPQEYQIWKSNLSKQKGMIIESSPDGGFRMVQGDVDPTKMPKLTEAEGKNAGFLKRALSAEKELSALESEGTSMWNKAAGNMPMGTGNYLVSADAQKFNQAKRNFINSVLRRESGAVISDSEFENANQQYFPQPGDDPQVIAQKRKNREDAIRGFEISSGPAATKVQEMDQQDNTQGQPVPAEDYFK